MTTMNPRQDREWVHEAIRIVEADHNRSADTHLLAFPLPASWNLDLYLKDESVHPTGSLKHRLARSLFLFGLCNGTIGPGTTIIEASSGSTAVSEAYFARMLGLPFVAVMPRTTSQQKIDLIEFHGGSCHLVDDPASIYEEARTLAARTNGHYLDQFTFAERVTDWRGNNNIAESIFEQMSQERHPVPDLGGARCRHRGHVRHHRPLRALQAARHVGLRRGPPGQRLPGQLVRTLRAGSGGVRLPDRGDRPATRRAVLRRHRRRRDDPGPGRRVRRRDALDQPAARPVRGRIDRHRDVGCAGPDRPDEGGGGVGQRGHDPQRRRQPLPGDVRRRRLGEGAGPGPRAVHRDLDDFLATGEWHGETEVVV